MNILVTSLPDLKKINLQRPHHLLRYLSKKHNITVLCVNAWWLKEKQDNFLKESLQNVKIHYLSENKLHPILQELFAARSLEHLSNNLDVHSFDVQINFNSLISGYIIAKKIKVPTVFDICDDIVSWISISPQVPTILKPAGKIAGSFLLNRNIENSKKITYSIEFLRDFYKLPENKSVLIPNGVDTNLFYRKNEKYEQMGLSDGDFVLGFVGFLGEWVSLDLVFKTMKEFDELLKIKLIVIGHGSKFLDFKNLAIKYEIQDKVIFIGDVSYLKVPDYISCMDVCLLPFDSGSVSQSALPIKLFEYMACEKPVISSPLSGVKNAVGDLVLYAKNVDELKQNILNLYYNADLRYQLGKNGRDFVRQNFSWDKICHEFEKVLIESVEERRY